MIVIKEDNVYKRVLVNKKTHFCHYYSVGNFSRVEIINLTDHFSNKMKNCISSAFKDHMNIFLNQKRKSRCLHCSFQLETFDVHNQHFEMCSKLPSCGQILFTF